MVVRITKPEFNLREKLSELDYSRVPYEKMPAGSIIQFKQLQLTNADVGGFFLTTTSSSFTQTNTDFSLSISPRFNTSKILITLVTFKYHDSNNYAYTTIYRDSTNLGGSDRGLNEESGNSHTWNTVVINFLDSPATTSTITYKIYGRCNGGTLYLGGDNDVVNTITLMEVKQ